MIVKINMLLYFAKPNAKFTNLILVQDNLRGFTMRLKASKSNEEQVYKTFKNFGVEIQRDSTLILHRHRGLQSGTDYKIESTHS